MTSGLTIQELRVQIDDAESHGMDCSLEKQLLATMQREAKLMEALKICKNVIEIYERDEDRVALKMAKDALISCEYSGVEKKDE